MNSSDCVTATGRELHALPVPLKYGSWLGTGVSTGCWRHRFLGRDGLSSGTEHGCDSLKAPTNSYSREFSQSRIFGKAGGEVPVRLCSRPMGG